MIHWFILQEMFTYYITVTYDVLSENFMKHHEHCICY